jgi:hypothetical protein
MHPKQPVTMEEAYRLAGIDRAKTTECWQNTLDTIIGNCLAAYENDPAYTFENLAEDLKEVGSNDMLGLSCPLPER